MLSDLKNVSFKSYMRFNFRCLWTNKVFSICILYYLEGFDMPNLLMKINKYNSQCKRLFKLKLHMLFPLTMYRSVTFLQRWLSLDLSACILTAGLKNKLTIPSRRFWGRGCNIICRWAAVWYVLRLLFPAWFPCSRWVWITKSWVEFGVKRQHLQHEPQWAGTVWVSCLQVAAWVCWVSS